MAAGGRAFRPRRPDRGAADISAAGPRRGRRRGCAPTPSRTDRRPRGGLPPERSRTTIRTEGREAAGDNQGRRPQALRDRRPRDRGLRPNDDTGGTGPPAAAEARRGSRWRRRSRRSTSRSRECGSTPRRGAAGPPLMKLRDAVRGWSDARRTPVGFGAPDWPPPVGRRPRLFSVDGLAAGAARAARRLRPADRFRPEGRGGVDEGGGAPPDRATAPGGGRVRGRYPGKTTSGNPDGNLPQFSQGRRYSMGAGVRPTGRSRRPAGPSGESSSLGCSPTVSSSRRP